MISFFGSYRAIRWYERISNLLLNFEKLLHGRAGVVAENTFHVCVSVLVRHGFSYTELRQ